MILMLFFSRGRITECLKHDDTTPGVNERTMRVAIVGTNGSIQYFKSLVGIGSIELT